MISLPQNAIDLKRERCESFSPSSFLRHFLPPLETPDTETIYTVVTQNILNIHAPGLIFTWDVKVTLMGLQKEDVSRKIVELYDLPLTWEEYADLAQIEIENLMKNCHLMPGNYQHSINLTNVDSFLFFFIPSAKKKSFSPFYF